MVRKIASKQFAADIIPGIHSLIQFGKQNLCQICAISRQKQVKEYKNK